jgi:signal transduction histidine kinase
MNRPASKVTPAAEAAADENVVTQPALVVDGNLLQQVLDALPVGVWIANPEGLLVANNPAGRNIWAGERWLKPDQYGEYKARWSATGKSLEPSEWGMARAVATGEVSHNEMVDIECFDGSRKTILNSAMPVRDASGSICAAVCVNQDITELKHTQDALELVRHQLEALSGAALTIQEQERKRLSMELHDEVGQTLSALKIAVDTARRRSKDATAVDLLSQATEMVNTLVTDVREIARRLRPPPLDDLGLIAALRWHLDRVARTTTIDIRLDAETLTERLGGDLELTCFRIVQEAVSNAVRHASASHITVTIDCAAPHLFLRIVDDGCGFQPQKIYAERGHHPLGLLGMRERAAMQSGELQVCSTPGQGTEIRAVFPLVAK